MPIKKHQCFSLVEAIISISLITIGLLAAISLLSNSLSGSMQSRDQLIAVFLAQEGIELARNIRDNNWANGRISFDSNYFPSASADNCIIDINSTNVKDCNNAVDHYKLYYSGIGSYYTHTFVLGSETKFQRKIKVTYNSGDTANVQSIVVWGGSFPASLTDCNLSNKCAYNEMILSKWGEE